MRFFNAGRVGGVAGAVVKAAEEIDFRYLRQVSDGAGICRVHGNGAVAAFVVEDGALKVE